uniref:Uncharacterized protein n=1 Tax=Cannabis sativa TaxID=3483 RepID=A0A803QRK2_CANSA
MSGRNHTWQTKSLDEPSGKMSVHKGGFHVPSGTSGGFCPLCVSGGWEDFLVLGDRCVSKQGPDPPLGLGPFHI